MGSFDAWVNNGGGSHVDVPVYTQATLPTPTVGLIVKLSDFNRGLWYANGTTWLPVGNEIIFNPIDFGADATGVLDSSTAINLAITSMSAVTFDSVGYVLQPSPGVYRLSAPVDIVRRLVFTGGSVGVTNALPPVSLRPDPGITGIIVHFAGDGSPDGGNGGGSIIQNLSISGGAGTGEATEWTASTIVALGTYFKPTGYSQYVFKATARTGDFKTGLVEPTWPAVQFDSNGGSLGTTIVDNHVTWTTCKQTAIWVRAPAFIKDVSILNMAGDGLTIVAGTGSTPATNANGSAVSQVYIENSNGNGFYIAGSDANACNFQGVNVKGYKGWGVWDSSFLGNWHAGHQIEAGGPSLGGYQSDDPNAYSTFTGCYTETDSGKNRIMHPATWVGGLTDGFTDDSTGFIEEAGILHNFTVYNSDGLGNNVRSSLATSAGGNTSADAFGAQAESSIGVVVTGTVIGLGFKQSGYGAGFWALDIQHANAFSYAIATNQQAYYPNATFTMPEGAALGAPGESISELVRLYTGVAAPTTGAHVVNEIVFNKTPALGDPLLWRCTTAGTPGTWEECYAGPEHRLTSTPVDLSLSTKQNLFTVPAGKSCIVTYVNSRGPSATITTAAGGVGYNAGGTDVAVLSMPTTTATYQITGFTALVGTIGAAASVLGFKTTATQAATTMTIDVFGYLF